MSSLNDELIEAYKQIRINISKNPDDKEYIINEYIDLVNKFNYLNNQDDYSNNNNNNNNNKEFAKMLKNPLEISIYNNFQKYHKEEPNINNPILNKSISDTDTKITNSKTQKQSINELVGVFAYNK